MKSDSLTEGYIDGVPVMTKLVNNQFLYFDSISPLNSFDPIIEDIRDSHIRRGHPVDNITTHEEKINHYICSCGALINRSV